MLHVSAETAAESIDLSRLIAEIRAATDSCIFTIGGASKMDDEAQGELLALLRAFTLLVQRGLRFVVGDGGTKTGLMEAAGLARRASGDAFPLIGIAPAPELVKTPIDPNHSHLIAVHNDAWVAKDSYWGSETKTMYWIFDRLAEGRPSVTLVANGGEIALDEVAANVALQRPMVLIAGSGRVADALIALLHGIPASELDDEITRFAARAQALHLMAQPALYRIFDLHAGPEALADLLAGVINPR
jgi:hypothetical protein